MIVTGNSLSQIGEVGGEGGPCQLVINVCTTHFFGYRKRRSFNRNRVNVAHRSLPGCWVVWDALRLATTRVPLQSGQRTISPSSFMMTPVASHKKQSSFMANPQLQPSYLCRSGGMW